jgi:CDP-paratose 2-epimerase
MSRRILITGGAGFIGANTAKYFSNQGWQVSIIDNLSRMGAVLNLDWLKTEAPTLNFYKEDVRNYEAIIKIVNDVRPNAILHLAGQVAVTTSVSNPREDFEINALGTFNMLEALRVSSPEAFFIYSSTNKVYGKLTNIEVSKINNRYEYKNLREGVDENQPLDFYSPYGCSKGAADQYVLDYSRIYGLKTTSFRQSCIYGERQFGIEDQGWVAWFSIAATLGKLITIYGDGCQIRDVLQVKDLAKAYEAALYNQDLANGQAFNIGGGSSNTMSLLELVHYIEDSHGFKIPLLWDDWRPGDQTVFVCDTSKARDLLKWTPAIQVRQGVSELIDWVKRNKNLFDWLN